MRNDYLDYLEHSAKGSSWKEHKYIAIKNGKYIYETAKNKAKSATETAKNKAKSATETVKNVVTKKIEDQKKVNEIRKEMKNDPNTQDLGNGIKISHDVSVGSSNNTKTNSKNYVEEINDFNNSSENYKNMMSSYKNIIEYQKELNSVSTNSTLNYETIIDNYKNELNNYKKSSQAYYDEVGNYIKENYPEDYNAFMKKNNVPLSDKECERFIKSLDNSKKIMDRMYKK